MRKNKDEKGQIMCCDFTFYRLRISSDWIRSEQAGSPAQLMIYTTKKSYVTASAVARMEPKQIEDWIRA